MTAAELLVELRRLGVVLTPDPPALRVNAPTGVLTDELKATLAANKPALLALLSGAEDEQRRPFSLTPRQTATAVDAWLRAGRPSGEPITVGLALLRFRRRRRRPATQRR